MMPRSPGGAADHTARSPLPTHQERRYNTNNQWDAVKTGGLWDTSPFAYDGLEQATTFNGTGGLGYHALGNLDAVGVQWAAGYRGDGLRMWKDEGAVRTYFLYGGEQLLAEMNASGTATAVNLWGADGLYGRVLNPEDPNTRAVVFYLGDVQGTIAQQVDASRQVVATAAYDAWGRPLTTGTAPYGYKGQWGYYTDADTGYILCTHRYYIPAAGRWLTRDPIGYEGGINLYAYCENDPVNYFDPTGETADAIYWRNTLTIAYVAALSDTPAPGPGDVVAGGILVVAGVVYIGVKIHQSIKVSEARKSGNGSSNSTQNNRERKVRNNKSGQNAKDDIPSWARQSGETPYKGESGDAFAKRLLDKKYSAGNWKKGAGTEHSKLKKWADTAFDN